MDSKQFDQIWNEHVLFKYRQLENTHGGLLFDSSTKNDTYTSYQELLLYTKHHYMKSPEDQSGIRINRYKIAASFMIALMKTKPIKKINRKYYTERGRSSEFTWCFNESLALYTGLSIIRSFFLADLSKAKEVSENSGEPLSEEYKIIEDLFLESIPFSKEDRTRLEIELMHLRLEGFSNVLSLAHMLEDGITIKRLEKKIDLLSYRLRGK